MAVETYEVVNLKDDFYRDGFIKALAFFFVLLLALMLLISITVYLAITKPEPVYFATDTEWRVLPPVPLDQPYLSDADLLQWVASVLQQCSHMTL